MISTRFCIIRHGETLWNAERRIQGHTDIGLSETGLTQAQKLSNWLANQGISLSHLYTSDLQRAWLTASKIGEPAKLIPVPTPAFRERRCGAFEGLTYQEAEQQYPEDYAALQRRDPTFPLPGGGESLFEFFERVSQALTSLVRLHPGASIGIVCHGGVLDIVNRFVRGNPLNTPRDFDIPNTGLNWVEHNPEQTPPWRIVEWGATPHLAAGALDELPDGNCLAP